jgi:hypothetical protein
LLQLAGWQEEIKMRSHFNSALLLPVLFGLTIPNLKAQDALIKQVAAISGHVHRVNAGGYWQHGGKEGFFRTVVMAGGADHVRHKLYVQWLTVTGSAGRYEVIRTLGIARINDHARGYLLETEVSYPALKSLQIAVTARTGPRDPVTRFVVSAQGNGSYLVTKPNR